MTTPSAILLAAVLSAVALPATAATAPPANKTWVSSTGTDTGSCPLAAPCRTFAYAISETNAGGEIDVRDSGAYGAFTIDKNITIVAAGVVASVGIGANTHAIDIATDYVKVDLVGLTVNTHSTSTTGTGISIDCSQCVISLDHMNVQGNQVGIGISNAAVILITNCHIASNYDGIITSIGNNTPIYIGNNSVTLNVTGLSRGNYRTYNNNQINGNTYADVSYTASVTSVPAR